MGSQPRGGDCREQASPHPPQHPQRSPYRSHKALPSCLVRQTLGPWEPVALLRGLLENFTFTFHFHALEKEMATHSSVLAWRIPGTGKPGGLPSMFVRGEICW